MNKTLAELNKALNEWYFDIIYNLPNIIVACIIVIMFIAAAAILRKLTYKLFDRLANSRAVSNLVSISVYIIVLTIGIIIALGVLNLESTVNKLLAGAGIIGLGLSFAFQDIFANIFAGAIIAVRRPFSVGDIIETNKLTGTVAEIRLRTVVMNNFYGQMIILPSKLILQNPIINYTFSGQRRVELEVGVSYGEDLEMVKTISLAAVKTVPSLGNVNETEFYYTEFGDSSINYIIRFWIEYKNQQQYLQAVSDAVIAIKKAFNDNNITIPFPIRTLDFGIKGGQNLTDAINNTDASLNKKSFDNGQK